MCSLVVELTTASIGGRIQNEWADGSSVLAGLFLYS